MEDEKETLKMMEEISALFNMGVIQNILQDKPENKGSVSINFVDQLRRMKNVFIRYGCADLAELARTMADQLVVGQPYLDFLPELQKNLLLIKTNLQNQEKEIRKTCKERKLKEDTSSFEERLIRANFHEGLCSSDFQFLVRYCYEYNQLQELYPEDRDDSLHFHRLLADLVNGKIQNPITLTKAYLKFVNFTI